MTNQEILTIAMEQSAIDSNCLAADFQSYENKVVLSAKHPDARNYLELPFLCDFTSYGNNIVASVSEEFQGIAAEYVEKFPIEHCFETPNLHWLMERLRPHGANVCFMAEYFLPDLDHFSLFHCDYKTKVLTPEEFQDLYLPEWSNALCSHRRQADQLCVGAYHHGKLVGLAGASADCAAMWQIGVDVLPNYRKQGIACAITTQLAQEILNRGIVPFYCSAWSNLKSVRNALKCGFRPAWVQMTIKPDKVIDTYNQ